jgi:hypothetical protein
MKWRFIINYSNTVGRGVVQYTGKGICYVLKKQNEFQNVENRILEINGSITFTAEKSEGLNLIMSLIYV